MSNYTTGVTSNAFFNKSPLDECIYKRHIDITYAMEIIYELYSDVLTLLDTSSLIYGGIVRDIVAGMFPLQGDLDIITSRAGYFPLSVKLEECNRVTRCRPTPSKRKYGRNPLIELTSEFVTHDGRRIQIIKSTESILDLINSTDMVCCGLVMTHDGEVFEIIRGAEDACKNRILTLNEGGKIIVPNLLERIDKLVKRGWESKISKAVIKKALRKKSTKKHKTGHYLSSDRQKSVDAYKAILDRPNNSVPNIKSKKIATKSLLSQFDLSEASRKAMKSFKSYRYETKKPATKMTTLEYSIDYTKSISETPSTTNNDTDIANNSLPDLNYDLVWR